MTRCDVVVVGAGIVGLASALQLLHARPQLHVVVLERSTGVATHQSGRSSGVLHTGMYYPPGSNKARSAVAGHAAMRRFCEEEGVEVHERGKLIVAATNAERLTLVELAKRADANGVETTSVGVEEMRAREPAVAGVAGLWVPGAAVVDYAAVCRAMARRIQSMGGEIRLGLEVCGLSRADGRVVVECSSSAWTARGLVNAAGLQSDRVARLAGLQPSVRIVPFRGEYFELEGPSAALCRGLIYPVARPGMPFLGVHLTRDALQRVRAGPNAVWALAREGYDWSIIDAGDVLDALSWPGTWRLFARHWRVGLDETLRSWSKTRFADAVRRLVPDVRTEDLVLSPSGVRAQALGRDGELVHDFVIERAAGMVHVVNAPSPAASASLELGRWISGLVLEELDA